MWCGLYIRGAGLLLGSWSGHARPCRARVMQRQRKPGRAGPRASVAVCLGRARQEGPANLGLSRLDNFGGLRAARVVPSGRCLAPG